MKQSLTLQHLSLTNICLAFLLCAAIIMLPDLAAAAGGNKIGETVCKVVAWFTGKLGKGIATLAIIVVGIGALMGKLSWGMALVVAVGVIIVFGATTIVTELGASGGSC
jgi:type IV secretory pathway VirB2 component (pilin)